MENKNLLLTAPPAISIVIPTYNVEKYIGELLDSILEQTFDNYEIILVDDCSTDNTLGVVKSYLLKFAEKNSSGGLKLVQLEKNSGLPGIPRNKGIEIARGEYLMFVDGDDVLASTTLEDLYSTAKEHDADVLSCPRHYEFRGETLKTATSLKVRGLKIKGTEIKELILEDEPVRGFVVKAHFFAMAWSYFFRRELILKNEVRFPSYPINEDKFFTFCAVFFAKKVFHIPNIYYYRRVYPGSISSFDIPAVDFTVKRIRSFVCARKALEEFTGRFDFFKDKPELTYEVFKAFFSGAIRSLIRFKSKEKIPAKEFDDIVYNFLPILTDLAPFTTFLIDEYIRLYTEVRAKNDRIKKLQDQDKQSKEQLKGLMEQAAVLQEQFQKFQEQVKTL